MGTFGTLESPPIWWNKITKRNNYNLPCQDHTSYGEDCVYFEPYPITMSDTNDLIKFCEKNKLKFSISANSSWNPPSTILIKITRQK